METTSSATDGHRPKRANATVSFMSRGAGRAAKLEGELPITCLPPHRLRESPD
jgi:hypothetical protein